MRGPRHALLLAFALALAGPAPAQEEKPFAGENHPIRRIELKGARVVDAIRLIAELSGLNIVSTEEAGGKTVTLYLQNVEAGRAVETVCKVAGLWYRRDEDTATFRVMTTQEYQKDHIVYRKDEIEVFTLNHPNAIVIAQAIEDLFGDRVELSLGIDEEEALDLPVSFGLGGQGLAAAADRSFGDGSRRSGGGYDRARDRFYRRQNVGTGRARESERVVTEELTPDQLERLAERDAEATAEALRGISRQDPTIYVTVNRQHNLIVVRTSDGVVMKEIAALVRELDRPTPQVLLEMKILELNVSDGFRSIFDIEYTGGKTTDGPDTGTPANPLLPTADTASRNVLGVGNFPLEGGTLVYQFMNDVVRARMQLLASDNRVNVLATPVLLASNNRPARMFVGEERVLTTGVNTDVVTPATGATTTSIEPVTETRDIGNTLVVIPKINADRTVTLFIVQDSSSVSPDSATIPVTDASGAVQEYPIDTVNTANLQATVVAKDGMTLAIGGLIKVELLDTEQKVPVLGDIPVIRFFFRKKVKTRAKSELVLLIRPRVLFTPAEADAATKERLRALSDHPYAKEGDDAYRADVDDLKDKQRREEERAAEKREKRKARDAEKKAKEEKAKEEKDAREAEGKR